MTPGECVGGPLDGSRLVAHAPDDVRGVWESAGRYLTMPLTQWPADEAAERLGIYCFEPARRRWTWVPD